MSFPISISFIFVLLLFLNGCISVEMIPKEEAENVLNDAIPGSITTGGIWLESQPIMINRDINMGLALGMDMIGPAIAVGKRNVDNKRIKVELEKSTDFDLTIDLFACPSCNRIATKSVFSILYGTERARLMTRVAVVDGDEGYSVLVLSQERKLTGYNSWTVENGQAIKDAIQDAVLLSRRLELVWDEKAGKEVVSCHLGDSIYLKGDAINSQIDGFRALKLKEFANTFVLCEKKDSKR